MIWRGSRVGERDIKVGEIRGERKEERGRESETGRDRYGRG